MKQLAQCVGLWLAEGDAKTENAVTFTNNCFSLVELFHKTVKALNPGKQFLLESYTPGKEIEVQSLPDAKTQQYIDDRASKPYYILAVYSTEFHKQWKKRVAEIKRKTTLYKYILQGFFAGEGNIYEGARKSRRIRIAQGSRDPFIESILDHFELDYRFRPEGRSYVITRKKNWDTLADLQVARHPQTQEIQRNLQKLPRDTLPERRT